MKTNLISKTLALLLLCSSATIVMNPPNLLAQCHPCHCYIDDTSFTPIPLLCSCTPTQGCLDDPGQSCRNSSQYAFYTQSDMCTIDSIWISGPSGVCWSMCCYPGASPYTGTPMGGCSENAMKLAAGVLIGPGQDLLITICAASTGNTFTMDVYSNGSSTPCVLTRTN